MAVLSVLCTFVYQRKNYGSMKTILYLTDLYYQANGRNYYEEDLYITSLLTPHFNLLIGHPQQVLAYMHCADLIVFRNTGPVIYYDDYFRQFVREVKQRETITFNSFDGKGDINGKQYLLDLTAEGFPVIPTVNNLAALDQLGNPEKYIVKLINGADSLGMSVLPKADLAHADLNGKIIQPFLLFVYEVSFYFLNNAFHYALYAPDKSKRWKLEEYQATATDLEFAEAFVAWNNLSHGIVRIDACRLPDGSLLLVEIEDLNPFLSLNLLPAEKKERFIGAFINALEELCAA